MLSVLSLVLPLLATPSVTPVGPSTLAADEPPVRLWLSGDRRFEPGDRARVQVEARDDGFLLVLNYDTDGRVRVLFPLDPRDDGFVRGGRRYEVRDVRSRESFVAGREGAGFVYVALSPDPWNLRGWARAAGWDYDLIAVDPRSDDPERDLTRLLEGVSGTRGFDYDLVEYFVHDVEIVRYEYRAPRVYYGPGVWAGDPWCDPYWSTGWFCGARPGVVVSYGRYYRGGWWSIGYGPSWYWPHSSWYGYRPYPYGRGYYLTYHRPWVWSAPTYRPHANRPVIVGRSRDYSTGRLSPWTFASGERVTAPATRAPDAYRPRDGGATRARPVTGAATAPEASRGRAVSDDRSRVPAATGRARPATDERSGSANPPAARPTGRRAGDGGAAPAARPASTPDRRPAAPPRARSRGNEDNASAAGAASRAAPERRPAVADGGRARVTTAESRPAAGTTVVRPPAPRAEPRREASPPRAQAAPSRAPAKASPPAASAARRDPPARSRGNEGRRGGN